MDWSDVATPLALVQFAGAVVGGYAGSRRLQAAALRALQRLHVRCFGVEDRDLPPLSPADVPTICAHAPPR